LALVAILFVLEHVSPVDPARAFVGPYASNAVVARERVVLGLNRPVWIQYVDYIGRLLHGNLGISAVTRQAIWYNIVHFFPATLELIITAVLISCPIGVLLGIASAKKWTGAAAVRFVVITLSSFPVFLTALLAILLFYYKLHWLPATGQTGLQNAPSGPTGFLLIDTLLAGNLSGFGDALQHLVLPAACLSSVPAIAIGRLFASGLSYTLKSDFVRTARSKGLLERRVVLRHALRNSAGAVLSNAGIQLTALFGTVILVEDVFAWPGIGLYLSEAIDIGDFGTIAGVTLAMGLAYIGINLCVDLLQAWADPRIRL